MKKWKRNLQCVHENEHSKAQNRTQKKTIKRLNEGFCWYVFSWPIIELWLND